MNGRVFNFNPGPAALPLSVLQTVQEELLNYNGTGMSVLEISHRSQEYEAINSEAEALIKEILSIPDNYRVLFMQGGASTQFAAIPLNLAHSTADYILTGSWSEKAYQEAAKLADAHIAASTKEENYSRIPDHSEIVLSNSPSYVHLCSNNTIFGTQWHNYPVFEDVPLIADMSSDLLSRTFDTSKFALIYGGAQKNLGPSGVTVVIIRNDLLEKSPAGVPTMLRFNTHAKNNSLYNTPPVFAVYMVHLMLKWIKESGGLKAIEKTNQEKSSLLYDVIDDSQGFYRGHAHKDSRSMMNITFRLPDADLEKAFLAEANEKGLKGLKGHRSVGGMRASVYNAVTLQACQALADFMQDFQRRHR